MNGRSILLPSYFSRRFSILMRCTLLVLLFSMLAAGCGQKGQLYLRDNPPPGVKPPKPEAYKPLPYPKEAGEDEKPGGTNK
jgi:predicted small lipoprotein YifL